MTYNPTNWQTGDIITAEKLNNIESGIALAPIRVTFTPDWESLSVGTDDEPEPDFLVDKSIQEIMDAHSNGCFIYAVVDWGEQGGGGFDNLIAGQFSEDSIEFYRYTFSIEESTTISFTKIVCRIDSGADGEIVSCTTEEANVAIYNPYA